MSKIRPDNLSFEYVLVLSQPSPKLYTFSNGDTSLQLLSKSQKLSFFGACISDSGYDLHNNDRLRELITINTIKIKGAYLAGCTGASIFESVGEEKRRHEHTTLHLPFVDMMIDC